jgi:hypothetical protein
MYIAPNGIALSNAETMAALQNRFCKIGYLDTALVDWSSSETVNHGSINNSCPNTRLVGRKTRHKLVDSPIRIGSDNITDFANTLQIVIYLRARFTIGVVADFGARKQARARNLNPN